MPRQITLKLDSLEVGQMLDALRDRQDAWQYTAQYLLSGCEEEDRIIEECSNPAEAQSIADFYSTIIKHVEEQFYPQLDLEQTNGA
jgi:hypothetical protein